MKNTYKDDENSEPWSQTTYTSLSIKWALKEKLTLLSMFFHTKQGNIVEDALEILGLSEPKEDGSQNVLENLTPELKEKFKIYYQKNKRIK